MAKDNQAPQAIKLADYLPPDFLIDTVELSFALGDVNTRVKSRLTLRKNPAVVPAASTLELVGRELNLCAVWLDGVALEENRYCCDSEILKIFDMPAAATLEIETEIAPQQNTSLEGLYKSGGNFCTQCEAQGFRKITYYLDRPDVMARFTTTILADRARYPVLLSNGNPVAQGELADGRHWVRWEDPFPKPCYLFALVAGDLACVTDEFVTRSGRSVQLRIYVQQHNVDKCAHAMISLKRAMAWDEQVFDLEYDLDIYMIVAVDDFNMGAMENKGLNIFNSRYVLADADSATDSDFQAIESVIAHEYFHNWTGNRVTCRDWFQLSLKEGLTVFRDQEFSADVNSRAVKRIADVRMLRGRQFPEDASPMAHPVRPDSYVEINNFYTLTVYEKGAELIRMIHSLLGAAKFKAGMDLYFARHDGQAVTCDDFLRAMQDASGVDLSRFMRWYSQVGTPTIEASTSYSASDQTFRLCLKQHTPMVEDQLQKLPLHIPVRVALLSPQGEAIPLMIDGQLLGDQAVMDFVETEQQWVFQHVPPEVTPSLLRNFSAPVRLNFDYSDTQLAFLLANDSDSFNRWDAGQQLAVRETLRLIEAYQDNRPLTVQDALLDAWRRVLKTTDLDPHLVAETIALPAEEYLGEMLRPIDVDAVHAAREALRKAIATALESELVLAYESNLTTGPYRAEPAAIGQRALRNTCLAYLCLLGRGEHLHRAINQFDVAANMTDVIAALRALSHTDSPHRDLAFKTFYQRWKNDPLVTDKWFALQATTASPATLKTVESLTQHPAFNLNNPNRVRSLLGAFAMSNPVGFHVSGGGGYEFLADHVLKLDALNPQVAARMASAFSGWLKYDVGRQSLMRDQLERIAKRQGISRDVFEVVNKSLRAADD